MSGSLFDLELLRAYLEEEAAIRAVRRERPELFGLPAGGPGPLCFATPTPAPIWLTEPLEGPRPLPPGGETGHSR